MIGSSPRGDWRIDLSRSAFAGRWLRKKLQLLAKVGDPLVGLDNELVQQHRPRLQRRLQLAASLGQSDLHRRQFVSLRLSLLGEPGRIDNCRRLTWTGPEQPPRRQKGNQSETEGKSHSASVRKGVRGRLSAVRVTGTVVVVAMVVIVAVVGTVVAMVVVA